MTGGIYKIVNMANGKIYIGSAKNFENRWKRHRYSLMKNNHCSIKLQRAVNKYGIDNFMFEAIEELPYEREIIIERENFYIQLFNSKISGYNIADASFGDCITNHPNRAAIIDKRQKTARNNMCKLSSEERQKLYGNYGESNGMFGKTHADSARKKMSDANKGHSRGVGRVCSSETKRKFSEIASKRVGALNPFYGKTHTNETKEYVSNLFRGRKPVNTKIVVIGGAEYHGLTDASLATGINVSTIAHRIRSSNPKFNQYSYKNEPIVESKPIVKSNTKPCSIDGNEYATLREAADALGVSISTISYRIQSKKYPKAFLI